MILLYVNGTEQRFEGSPEMPVGQTLKSGSA